MCRNSASRVFHAEKMITKIPIVTGGTPCVTSVNAKDISTVSKGKVKYLDEQEQEEEQ